MSSRSKFKKTFHTALEITDFFYVTTWLNSSLIYAHSNALNYLPWQFKGIIFWAWLTQYNTPSYSLTKNCFFQWIDMEMVEESVLNIECMSFHAIYLTYLLIMGINSNTDCITLFTIISTWDTQNYHIS